MYLGDPREQQICPDEHTIWEEDNRVEKRYQWGARILDLCDLGPKEYAQTIFYTKDAPTDLIKNVIVASFDATSVKFSYPYSPASDIYVVLTDSEGGRQVVIIPSGDASPYTATLEGIDPAKITTVFIGLTEDSAKSNSCEDSTYAYSIIKRPVSSDYAMYVYMKHTMVEDGLTEEEVIGAGVQNANINDKSATFKYNIAPVAVTGFNNMDDDEYNQVIAREQLDLLIFTSSQISGIYLNETDDQTSSWIRNYTSLQLNGVQYYVSKFVQNDLVNIYDPIDESPRTVIFTYKITMS